MKSGLFVIRDNNYTASSPGRSSKGYASREFFTSDVRWPHLTPETPQNLRYRHVKLDNTVLMGSEGKPIRHWSDNGELTELGHQDPIFYNVRNFVNRVARRRPYLNGDFANFTKTTCIKKAVREPKFSSKCYIPRHT